MRADQEKREHEMRRQFDAEREKMGQQYRMELERKEKELTAHFASLMPPPQSSSPDQQNLRQDHYRQESRQDHIQFYDQSSPHLRRSYESPGSTVDAKLKLKKAFNEIRDAPER